jgi:alpha-aminoadipate carrier protein LysW
MSQVKTQVVSATCPDCGQTVRLRAPVRMGQQVECPHCDAELEVIETDPIELDWMYEDEDGDEDEDEDW